MDTKSDFTGRKVTIPISTPLVITNDYTGTYKLLVKGWKALSPSNIA